GLTAKTVPLPQEKKTVANLSDNWFRFVDSDTPVMVHLTNECIRGNLLANRGDAFRQSQLQKQAATIKGKFRRRQRERLNRLKLRMPVDPYNAIEAINGFALGVNWKGNQFAELIAAVGDRGYLTLEEH